MPFSIQHFEVLEGGVGSHGILWAHENNAMTEYLFCRAQLSGLLLSLYCFN